MRDSDAQGGRTRSLRLGVADIFKLTDDSHGSDSDGTRIGLGPSDDGSLDSDMARESNFTDLEMLVATKTVTPHDPEVPHRGGQADKRTPTRL